MQIIQSEIEDASSLENLVNRAYRGDSSKKGWTTEADLLSGTRVDTDLIKNIIQQPGSVILKCVDNNEIVGCVELRITHNEMYLGMLTVDPALQGRGIGKILLQACETKARESGCNTIVMTVISVRAELIAWYIRHGYRDTGIHKPFNTTDPRFGIPLQTFDFLVLEKRLS